MAYFHRLIAALVLALCSFSAFAENPVTQYRAAYISYGEWRSTNTAACADAVSFRNASAEWSTWVLNSASGTICNVKEYNRSTGALVYSSSNFNVLETRQWCDAAAAAPVGGVCPPPSVCTGLAGMYLPESTATANVGAISTSALTALVQSASLTFCDSTGCQASGKPTFGGVFGGNGSVTVSQPKYTGQPCDATAAPGSSAPQDAPKLCSAGTCPGSVNGVTNCYPCQTGISADSTTVTGTSSVSGGSATTSLTTSGEVTLCDGSRCTTTVSVSSSSSTGSTPTTRSEAQTTVQDQATFCQANPTSPFCKAANESTFGSAPCGSVPTCTGDAVQCATAREVFRAACALNPGVSTESALYDSSKSVNSAGVTSTAVAISSASFSEAAALGAGACISDKTITVWNKTVVIPLSTVCPSLGYLKTILLAISYIAAFGIVFRSAA